LVLVSFCMRMDLFVPSDPFDRRYLLRFCNER
jgi:hypothetical protein